MTNKALAIDSSAPDTLRVGLDIYGHSISRPAINLVNLEPRRDTMIPLTKEYITSCCSPMAVAARRCSWMTSSAVKT
jgi:hypothetical protein